MSNNENTTCRVVALRLTKHKIFDISARRASAARMPSHRCPFPTIDCWLCASGAVLCVHNPQYTPAIPQTFLLIFLSLFFGVFSCRLSLSHHSFSLCFCSPLCPAQPSLVDLCWTHFATFIQMPQLSDTQKRFFLFCSILECERTKTNTK